MYGYKLTRIDHTTGSTHTWYSHEKHVAAAVENHKRDFPHCELRIRQVTDEEVTQIYRGI